MTYNVTTYIKNAKISSDNVKIKNKTIYEIINKYIRTKEEENKLIKAE